MEPTDWANCIQTESSGRIWFTTCPRCPQGDLRLSQWQNIVNNFDLPSTAEPQSHSWPRISFMCACYIYVVATVSHFFHRVIPGALYSALTVNKAVWWIAGGLVLNHTLCVNQLEWLLPGTEQDYVTTDSVLLYDVWYVVMITHVWFKNIMRTIC